MPSPVRTRYICVSTAILISFLGAAVTRAQQTINVPANQPTIQTAINAANNGDTVLVAPGTYFENINFNGKAITVTSSAGAAQTIIDGGQNGPVVTFDNGETTNSVLNSITIQNGHASYNGSYDSGRGGGIQIINSSPTITGNIISGN